MAGEQILVIDDSPTITRTVQLVLSRSGYRVELAEDGEAGLAAARRRRPDLILLDFVMPRMNGYQVCVELAADPELAAVPVVLMSARGDQVGERFVRRMGIVEYLTKPISADRLTEVVARVFARERATTPTRPPTRPLLEDTFDSLDVPLPVGAPRTIALGRLRDQLAAAIAQRAAHAAGPIPTAPATATTSSTAASGGPPAGLAAVVRAALDDATLERLLEEAEATSGEGELRGELRVIPLAEILRMLAEQELSGVLAVSRLEERVEVYLRRGKVEQAMGQGLGEELRLGRFLLDRGLLEPARFEAFLQARFAGGLLGQQLVAAGHLDEDALRAALTRQSSELIFETLRWRTGRFSFRAGLELPPAALEANLGLAAEALIEEGGRRADEWHLIERLIDSALLVFAREETAEHGRRLSREEQLVLDQIDGRRRVADLIRASRLGSFEVCRALYRLVSLKLVRRAAAE
jgi:CheY-like chemotaxis protein